jgi:hypothetical protein
MSTGHSDDSTSHIFNEAIDMLGFRHAILLFAYSLLFMLFSLYPDFFGIILIFSTIPFKFIIS